MEINKAKSIIQKLKEEATSMAYDKTCTDYSSPYLEYNSECQHFGFWYDIKEHVFYKQRWTTDNFENIISEEPKEIMDEITLLEEIQTFDILLFR